MGYVEHSLGVGFFVWCSMIVLGFILFYFLRSSSKNVEEQSSVQDILDKRYANGEINRQAYEDKSKALRRIA
ncbi:hypothetical protein [Sulfurovum sp.]|uniref:hypothetical protein n=1 Tax=Sulfurovum sp. TaxID=1969726 RepID=UPI003566D61B